MMQYAVWNWYDEILTSLDSSSAWGITRNTPTSVLPAVKSLLDHGADLFTFSKSCHTILDGLFLNFIQFDGYDRSPEAFAFCLDAWLSVVQGLGFSVKEYIRREADEQNGTWHDLGLGLRMGLRFNEDEAPHAWTIFQGPQELANNEFKTRISQCAIWKQWQLAYSLPKPPPRSKLPAFQGPSVELIVLNEQSTPVADHNTDTRSGASFASRTRSQLRLVIFYFGFLARYRYEFTFYICLLASFAGVGYFARFWITASFFLASKLFHDLVL